MDKWETAPLRDALSGMMKDLAVLQESPFSDLGGVGEIFEDDATIFMNLRVIIETINQNAAA